VALQLWLVCILLGGPIIEAHNPNKLFSTHVVLVSAIRVEDGGDFLAATLLVG